MPVRSTSLPRRAAEPGTAPPPSAADPREALTKWADVDARALCDNARALRARVGEGVAVMAMVKANGFGHGMLTAARAARAGGAAWLGVSCAEEALALREAGIEGAVLVTGWSSPPLVPDLVRGEVDLTVYDRPTLEAAVAGARAAGRRADVHLKVDSGMGRLGARPAAVPDLVRGLAAAGDVLRLRGVFTHFASAESDEAFTLEQHARFLEAADVALQIAPDALRHAANSAATLAHPRTWHDVVRVGIAFYGYPPVAQTDVVVRPAMTVHARVTQLRTVEPGDSAGYGRTWRASRRTRVATVAAGYADGVLRSLSNRGAALVGGVRAPVVGRVSMDQTTVDVSEVDGVREGDAAVLLGPGLDAVEVAEMAGTIANDVLCAVTARVPRLVVEG